jgi:glycosyltransferase involved in cell wall biosynthesis
VKILMSAFACGPGFGSEEGNGWNWSASLADVGHQVTVLTRPERRAEIDAALAARSDRALRVIYVETPRWALAVKGHAGVYTQYLAWQRAAYRLARRLVQRHPFDLVHHISWGSLQLGTWMGRLPIPLVFGPVGGGQTAPRSLRRFYAGDWRTEVLRTFVTEKLMAVDPFARMATRRARLVLVNNEETGRLARRLGAMDVRYASELGVPPEALADTPPQPTGDRLRLLWVGRLMPRKGLPLALQAIALARRNVDVHLTVVGGGPQADRVAGWIEELRITDAIEATGPIPFEEVQAAYRSHDALLFSSLRDSTGAQILEAMAAGLPVIALKQSGSAVLIGAERGVLVEPGARRTPSSDSRLPSRTSRATRTRYGRSVTAR